MGRPRSSLAELGRMLRVAEPGSNNLGYYLAEAGEDLAVQLGVEAETLAGLVELPDETIAPMLAQLLEHRASERMAAHHAEVRDAAMSAAQRLGATAIWTNDAAGRIRAALRDAGHGAHVPS